MVDKSKGGGWLIRKRNGPQAQRGRSRALQAKALGFNVQKAGIDSNNVVDGEEKTSGGLIIRKGKLSRTVM
jgi:hypothetical protein